MECRLLGAECLRSSYFLKSCFNLFDLTYVYVLEFCISLFRFDNTIIIDVFLAVLNYYPVYESKNAEISRWKCKVHDSLLEYIIVVSCWGTFFQLFTYFFGILESNLITCETNESVNQRQPSHRFLVFWSFGCQELVQRISKFSDRWL